MALVLYNTATRRKEAFEPLEPGLVRLYVCGPTPYDYAHIGNARAFVAFDVLYRLLRARYGKVIYVRNITDVDDKINAAAREEGVGIDVVTARTIAAFHADMAALNVLPPTVEPRVTAHIAQIVAMIATLIAKGHAYLAEGHVLFHVPSMVDYGSLSGHSRDELIAGARIDVAPYKRDPGDFVLWKPSTPDLPGWDSPWGRGRPGWHIECSAMAETHLGLTIDIHGGGRDLVFPHHENERAQSLCAHGGVPFVRYWVHNGFVTVEGEKMSKSLGNFRTPNEVLRQAPGEAIRLALLAAHYRQPLDWTDDGLKAAKARLDNWYTALRLAEGVPAEAAEPGAFAAVLSDFARAMDDDLNTPMALGALDLLAGALNKATDRAQKAAFKAALVFGAGMIGLLNHAPEDWFKWQPPGVEGLDERAILDLIEQRLAARKAKDFARADAIRKQLADGGVLLEDKPGGRTEWKRAS
ncbi:MAG: cysteine--tRNA ligase [Alphaproteobacteria bacterium]|nr:cysteine--tRNA ligase [Alphaproteobacteria bacterium]